ncbi:hypothetical protein H632_c831p0, partial [Helicosporidium sp. ATCC 50920]
LGSETAKEAPQPSSKISKQAPDEEWILKEATRSSKRQPKRPSAGSQLPESERYARLLLNKTTQAVKKMAQMERRVEEAYGTPSHRGTADGCEGSASAGAVPENSRRVAARTSLGSSPLASPPSPEKAERAGRDSAGASASRAAALAPPPASGCEYLEVVFQWSSGSRSVVLPSDKPLRAEFEELRAALQAKGVCSDSDELAFIFDGDRLASRQTPAELGLDDGDVVDVRVERRAC